MINSQPGDTSMTDVESQDSAKTDAKPHPLEGLPTFDEHMQTDLQHIQTGFEPQEDDDLVFTEWPDEWFEVDEETRKNIESWGSHKSDKDFDPSVRLSEEDLIARDIDSMGRKRNSFQQERAQELFERKLNAEMTDISDLELMAENNTEGLSISKAKYQDKEISIIDVSGYPLKFLKSFVNSSIVREDPRIWTINGQNYKSFSQVKGGGITFDPASGEASNTICTTYVDTDINPHMANGSDICYVFTHVKPDSVIDAGPGDIWSDTDAGSNKPSLLKSNDLNMPEDIASKSNNFNEVTLRRYDEAGNPLLPTALLIHNRMEPTEIMLRNAAFYNIPIIHVNTESYQKPQNQ